MKKIIYLLLLILLIIGCKKEKMEKNVKLTTVTGTVKSYVNFKSEFVESRNVDIWLPESYDKNGDKRYAAIYMHDGQNLFDPEKSYIGVDWGMDETMTWLIKENRINEAIVVGIWNTPKRRREYMPQKAFNIEISDEMKKIFENKYGGKPISDFYLKFIVNELKPFIDKTYRTFADKNNTFILGSSMGGLISAYAICEYPDIFGGAGCVSTHWPIIDGIMLQYFKKYLPQGGNHKFYFDYGTETLDAEYESFQKEIDQIMVNAGYIDGETWITKKFEGDEHSERAWRKRVHIPVEFLLGN